MPYRLVKYPAVIIFSLIVAQECFGQTAEMAVFAKTGIASFGRVDFAQGAPTWRNGPIAGGGVLFKQSDLLSLLISLDYAANRMLSPSLAASSSDAVTRRIDASVELKLTRSPFFLLGGMGSSYQFTNAYAVVYDDGSLSAIGPESEVDFFLAGGLGAQVPLTDRITLFMQVGGRLRTYGSLTLETGVSYQWTVDSVQ